MPQNTILHDFEDICRSFIILKSYLKPGVF